MVKPKTVWWGVGLGLLILVGTALRVWGLQSISLDVDEAITISAARGFLALGRPVILASGLYYGRDILGTLTTAGSLAMFGVSEWAARLPMVLLGVATIPMTYGLGRQLKLDRSWALLAAAGVTFSGWSVYYAHSARMYQEQQFFVLLAVILAIWTTRRWTWPRVFLTLTATLLAILAQRSAVVLLPIWLVLGLVQERSAVKSWWRASHHRLWFLLGLLVALLGLLVLEIQLGILGHTWSYVLGTDKNPFAAVQLHLIPWRHLWRTYPVWLLGLLLAWLWVRRNKGLQVVISVAWVVLISVDLFIFPYEPNYRVRYFYDMLPLFFCLGSFGLANSWVAVRNRLTNRWSQGAMVGILLVTLFVDGVTIHPATVYADQPEWNRLAGIQAPVVIAHPTAPANYYLGHVDFWLVSHKGEIRTYSEQQKDIYAGAQVLLDPNKLKEVLTTQHGVVVVETNRLKFISKELEQALKANAKKDQELSTDLLQIWRF